MYSFGFYNIIVTINGTTIDTFADGDDVVKFEPLADAATTKVGADGHMIASISANRGATCTLKLLQTSPGNAFLQNLYNLQISYGAEFQPLAMSVKDAMKKDAVTATGGILTKQPVWQRGEHSNDCEWVIQFETCFVDIGLVRELANLAGVAASVIPGVVGAVAGAFGR